MALMSGPLIRIAAVLFATISTASIAQTHTWINPNGGDWADPLNWSPNDVPQGPSASPLLPDLGSATPPITLPSSLSLGSLIIASPYELLIEDSLAIAQTILIHESAHLSAINPESGAIVYLESGASLSSNTESSTPALVTLAETTIDVFNGSIHNARISGTGTLRSSGDIDLFRTRLESINLVPAQFNYAEFRFHELAELDEVSILLSPNYTQPVLRVYPESLLELTGTIHNHARIFVKENARVLVHGSTSLIGPGGVYAYGPSPASQIFGSTADASLTLIDHSLLLSESESGIPISLQGDLSVQAASRLNAPLTLQPDTRTILEPATFREGTAITSSETIHLAGQLTLRRTHRPIAHGNAWTARLIHADRGLSGAYDTISFEPTDRTALFSRVRITDHDIIAGDVCPADLTMDFVVDERDIAAFEDAFAANDQLADLNRDGSVDQSDQDAFDMFYITPCNPCRYDFNNDTNIDHFDVSTLIRGIASQASFADLNEDAMFDILDVLAFIEATQTPCP